jgi:PGDYG protein
MEYLDISEDMYQLHPQSARMYRKTGTVNIERVAESTSVVTTIINKNGTFTETTNVATPGSYIVTNPGGERYVLDKNTVKNRYEHIENDVFAAKGLCKAVENPFKQPIKLMASWGEMQYGDSDCYIAVTCDEHGVTTSDPYLIDREAFERTYAAHS